MFTYLRRQWLSRLWSKPARRGRAAAPRRFRPALEALEERTVPALFWVNTLADDNSGGVGANGVGDLRYAITQANNAGGTNVIQFVPGLTGMITLDAALPNITNNLDLPGPGADVLVVNANQLGRVLALNAGVTATIAGLTVTGGNTNEPNDGAGIYNSGNLSLTGCIVCGNSTFAFGAGLDNTSTGTLTVSACTFFGNFADQNGGGIENSGTARVTNSTFFGNTAAFGGGIDNTGVLTVDDCTISGNSANALGGGISQQGSSMTMHNTIDAGNAGALPDLYGSATMASYNLIGNTIGLDLGPLENNGGPTPTMALLPGSVAINAGDPDTAGLTPYDQRGPGFSRVIGNQVDIGAYEYLPPYSSTLTLTSASPTAVAGEPLSFIATVQGSSNAFIPGGTVSFSVDGSTPVQEQLSADGEVVFTPPAQDFPGPGIYIVTAVYNGDSNFNTSSAAIQQRIVQAASTTLLTSSAATASLFDNVTFTATVDGTPGGSTPTGTVTFYLNGTQTPVSLSGGQATFSPAFTQTGDYIITAVYSGDRNYNGSSAAWQQTITRAPSAVTLISSAPIDPLFGTVRFTAAVTGASGGSTPTGAVSFAIDGVFGPPAFMSNGQATYTVAGTSFSQAGIYMVTAVYTGDSHYTSSSASFDQVVEKGDDTISFGPLAPVTYGVGPLTLNATGGGSSNPVTFALVSGPGTLNGNVLTVNGAGAITIEALQAGDANYNDATPVFATLMVNPAATSMATPLTVSPTTPSFGEPVSVTAQVSNTSPGSTATPDGGFIVFSDNGRQIGVALLSNGSASINTTFTGGTQYLSATYSGDSNFLGSSTAGLTTLNVTRVATTVALASDAPGNTVQAGQQVTLSASVSGPAGIVTFYDGSTALGAVSVDLGASVATLNVTFSVAATHNLSAQFAPADLMDYAPSSSTLPFAVTAAAPASVVVTSGSGQSVLTGNAFALPLMATVTDQYGNPVPNTSVTFTAPAGRASATFQGNPATTNSQGQATVTVTANSTGGSYNVEASVAGVSTPATFSLNNFYATTTALKANTVNLVFGQSIALSAAVAVPAGMSRATGTVTFYDQGDAVGSAPLIKGVAKLVVSNLDLGSDSYTASYNGNAVYAPSTSAALSTTVAQARTWTRLWTSDKTPQFGDTVTLTARVYAATPASGIPSGTVTFMNGSSVLGTASLIDGVASLAAAMQNLGRQKITAVYSGDDYFLANTSAALIETVVQAQDNVQLSATPTSASAGTPITFSATVVPANGGTTVPSGTITLFDGTRPIGTMILANGTATLTLANLKKGAHSITASYSGDTDFLSNTSAAVTVTIT